MSKVLARIVTITWALWLGGMITLIIFVTMLFRSDRPTALEAAPRVFVTFGNYQLILAAVAMIAAALWRVSARSKWITILFATFALSALGAILLSQKIVPRMEEIRLAGKSHESAEYKSLHGRTSTIYSCEAALLLIAGLILPAAIADSSRQRSSAGSAAEDSQV